MGSEMCIRDSWETAPWYSVEGLQDIANLHDNVIDSGYQYTVESLNGREGEQ